MENPIKRIVQFNQQANLIEPGYNDFLESSFLIEEALEGFHDLSNLAKQVLVEDAVTGYDAYTPKEVSRAIVSLTRMDGQVTEFLSDVQRLDKACDAAIYAIGSIAKLGLNAQQITQALNIVMNANFKKLNGPKDEFGKQLKPEGWVGPEAELQALLDKR